VLHRDKAAPCDGQPLDLRRPLVDAERAHRVYRRSTGWPAATRKVPQ
jgi:hypothetical protein